mgnify:FL=1
MNHMLPEGLHPQPEGYTREELLLAMQQRRVLQARAVLCDERHALLQVVMRLIYLADCLKGFVDAH